jgi:hypothetical protein
MVTVAYAAAAMGARLSLADIVHEPVTVASCRVKVTPLHVRRSYFGPEIPANTGLVEPPGTAPGSEPLITRTFITIAPEGK